MKLPKSIGSGQEFVSVVREGKLSLLIIPLFYLTNHRFLEIESLLLESGAQTKADLWVCSVLLPRTRSGGLQSAGLRSGGRWALHESTATKVIVSIFGDMPSTMREIWLKQEE